MRYHAPSQDFTISIRNMQDFTMFMRYAIAKLRESAGLPLEGGPRPTVMTAADHAETALLQACDAIGIDLGATRAGELDVRFGRNV